MTSATLSMCQYVYMPVCATAAVLTVTCSSLISFLPLQPAMYLQWLGHAVQRNGKRSRWDATLCCCQRRGQNLLSLGRPRSHCSQESSCRRWMILPRYPRQLANRRWQTYGLPMVSHRCILCIDAGGARSPELWRSLHIVKLKLYTGNAVVISLHFMLKSSSWMVRDWRCFISLPAYQ